MATELATSYVVLLPKFNNMQSSIEKEIEGADYDGAGRSGGKALGSGVAAGVQNTSATIGSTLKSVVGIAAGALAAIGFSGLVSEAATATDSIVKFKQTLGFADLDTSTIDALTASTKKYADETVYELSDIQNVTAQLAANSVPNYDKLAEAAGNLNAVAGGNADTFKSVGMVLTQTAGQGKLTTENWNQLADAIPGASGKLQEAMIKNGAYTGNFREAMEKGEITADEFNQAIMDLGMTDAAKEAATSTATFEGAFGNLQATVVSGLSELLSTAQPAITTMVNAVNDMLTPAFSAANVVVKTFSDAVTAGASPIDALTAAFKTLPGEAQIVVGVVGGMTAAFIAFKAATTAKSLVSGIAGIAKSVGSIAGRGAAAGAGLAATAAGEKAAGSAAGTSAKSIMASAVAIVALGAGIALACAGLALLGTVAIQLADAGPAAILTMVGMVAAIALLAIGAAALGPALTAGSIGFLAFGAAILMVGAGIGLASAGFALLASQLPTISEYGLSASLAIVALAGSAFLLAPALMLAGAGALVLGAGALVAGAGIIVFAAGVVVASAGVTLMAVAVALLAAGVILLSAGVLMAASGIKTMGDSLPAVAENAPGAAVGIAALAAACFAAAGGLLAGAAAIAPMAVACDDAAASTLIASAAFSSATSAVLVLAAMAATIPGVMNSACTSVDRFADSANSSAQAAKSSISSALSSIASSVASCKLEFPRIDIGALPHFSFSGTFNAETGSVPSLNVDWYGNGAIFGRAAVIGIGERGDEAAVPLSGRRMKPFADAVSSNMTAGSGTTNINIGGLTYNDDSAIGKATKDYLEKLIRLGAM